MRGVKTAFRRNVQRNAGGGLRQARGNQHFGQGRAGVRLAAGKILQFQRRAVGHVHCGKRAVAVEVVAVHLRFVGKGVGVRKHSVCVGQVVQGNAPERRAVRAVAARAVGYGAAVYAYAVARQAQTLAQRILNGDPGKPPAQRMHGNRPSGDVAGFVCDGLCDGLVAGEPAFVHRERGRCGDARQIAAQRVLPVDAGLIGFSGAAVQQGAHLAFGDAGLIGKGLGRRRVGDRKRQRPCVGVVDGVGQQQRTVQNGKALRQADQKAGDCRARVVLPGRIGNGPGRRAVVAKRAGGKGQAGSPDGQRIHK